MSQPRTLFEGFQIMFIGVFLSLMLIATVGQMGDRTITILIEDVGIFEVNEDWAANIHQIYTIQSLLYLVSSLPGLSGITIFILSAVRRQRYDVSQQIDYTAQFGGAR